MTSTPAALALSRISKRFGVVPALSEASLTVRAGAVHALLGENGAGKTTLMRVAFGMVQPDAGAIAVAGKEVRLATPAAAMALGIGMVHQHFTLVPAMTVAENVSLGMRGRFDVRGAASLVRDIGKRTGLALEPDALAGELPVGAQQRLEIVKALARDVRILILDEPTAVLAPAEADDLLAWVRRWASSGNAAILITHKIREARAIAHDITVLRKGSTVLSDATARLSENDVVRAMLGGDAPSPQGDVPVTHVAAERPTRTRGASVLRLRGASVRTERGPAALHDATLDVHAGEILGIAAVEGAGQHELLRLLAGRLQPTDGTAELPPSIAFIPEDRHRDALVLDMTLTENVALHALGARTGTMPWVALRAATGETIEQFDVRAGGSEARARELSGGNQQKLVLGRELRERPQALVAENPTRGLDIRATAAVHNRLRSARDAGCAVVVYSSDLDEVLALADRVVVVHAGAIREVSGTRDDIGRAMLGAA